jgi:amino acid permease
MTSRKPLVVLCIVLAVVFVGLAVLYFTTAASDLPGFLPGHLAGSSRHHTKHGLAMLMLAAVSVVGAWMLSGPAGSAGPRATR